MPRPPNPSLGTVYMGGGKGRLWGRDIKRDLAIHIYIYILFVPFQLSGIPVRTTEIPAKTRQFLSYKHSVPLCRDDIMTILCE